ncbi:polysialyltransferase family glycosyltransferase [Brevibacterium sp. BRM-1]|uniref:polysialyltransferase family glycosyltransferase n=1 Tax=Brevibacterium sp. BRM-1 TaxID=2999062 RepID=UPI0022827689|nr:polysialyltransferase family glycosyltransferase [Brevibacterium sp. BRM-1]WAL40121.1 polysialyltransferase family glycosyltransferase [Brevibacterium sp. BRM-1]
MKQIFLASTTFEVAGLAAGIDTGAYDSGDLPQVLGGGIDPHYPPVSERILLLSDNARTLEVTTPLDEQPGMAALAQRFDRVLSLNAALAPLAPGSWAPREEDAPILERLLRSAWDLGTGPLELIVESPQVNPAIALCRIFRTARVRVHADGLMSFAPTRSHLPLHMGQRTTSLHYLPLAGTVRPRLLMEFGITPRPVPAAAFRSVLSEIADAARAAVDAETSGADGGSGCALVVGQYLAALGVLTTDEEEALHVQMLEVARARGAHTVLFKPHPAAPPATTAILNERSAELGVTLKVLATPVIAEAVMDIVRPSLVVGGFSTALATADFLFDIPVCAVGTELILARLTPYQNSNRIPATIIDACAAEDAPAGFAAGSSLQLLVDAVGYCMQPDVAALLRPQAEELLSDLPATARRRWFRKRRIQALGLPGAQTPRVLTRTRANRWRALATEAQRLHIRPLLQRARSSGRRIRLR